MRTDSEIKQLVEAELRWRPEFDESDIAVAVQKAVVTLSGFARNFFEKYQAERAAKGVVGVAGVANDIQVRIGDGHRMTDPEIARDAVANLKAELPKLSDRLQVLVHQGHVTLEGVVEWYFQRQQAEQAVRQLKSINGVTNMIEVRPQVAPDDIKRKIEAAFQRSASVDAKHVSVEADGGQVTLKGHVHSWIEREAAEDAASAAPGVIKVKNEISVGI